MGRMMLAPLPSVDERALRLRLERGAAQPVAARAGGGSAGRGASQGGARARQWDAITLPAPRCSRSGVLSQVPWRRLLNSHAAKRRPSICLPRSREQKVAKDAIQLGWAESGP